ncbi:MAG: DNA primase [Gammaproteobacteria bacterium]|nr:DNA primase [Gammaproteobacteria bacterium]
MPFIDRDFINDLSDRVDIVGLINKRVPLKKAGKDYKACCPFHEEKTPSFTVVPNKQIFHCFGCGESGGAIDFIKKFDHLDFVEAVETVASESGISVVYDQNVKPVDTRFKRYNEVMIEVSGFYQDQLKNSAAKARAVDYAKKRGISGAIAKRFELGYAPPGWSNLFERNKGNTEKLADLETLGMLVAKKDKVGDCYDRFRDRLMFPIHNAKGNVIGFGGRVLSVKDNPKYLNSPETPLFSKSKELYGLYHCRKHSRKIDYILVVEGYMDVIALHQHGITTAVATLGTATTPTHLQTLSRTTDTIVFCFDGDKAGRAAAWKALQISLPAMTAGLMIKFLLLPDGEDPDTLIQSESVKAFSQRVEKAQTLSSFLFDHIKSEVPFETIEGKTLFLEQASALINLVTYSVYRQQLVEGLAQVVGQNTSHVEKMINQSEYSAPSAQEVYDAPPNFDEPPMEEVFYHEPVAKKAPDSGMKGLMSKMISCILNYPMLADDTVELRVRNLPKSNVLLELIHSAQIDEEISQQVLIKPFEAKSRVYARLQQLCVMEPSLSENEAKDEFLSALTLSEKQHQRSLTSASISTASTSADEKKIMEEIQHRKKPKSN